MTDEDLARAVAGELGGDVAAETEKQINGESPRAFGVTEAVLVATFVVQCAQLAVQVWDAAKDRVALAARLDVEAPQHGKLDPEKRKSVILRIADKMAAMGEGAGRDL